MKHRHYAPKAEVILVEGTVSVVKSKIQEIADAYSLKNAKVGILATDETQKYYRQRR